MGFIKSKGFSLLEMIAVLLILVLIGGVFINLGLRTMHQGYQDTLVNVVSAIAQGIQNYYRDVGSYPNSLKDLEESSDPNWAGKYIDFPLENDNTASVANGKIKVSYIKDFSGNTDCGYISDHPALKVYGTDNPPITGLCKAELSGYTYYVLP